MTRVTGSALAALAVALVACPAAAAHGGGNAGKGYRSAVRNIVPRMPGLEVRVVAGDDRLRLTNHTGAAVVVFGYTGEPYLRFTARGIEQNLNSPSVYLNRDRYGTTGVPPGVDEKAPPKWKLIGGGPTYEWHDHRIHWMSTIPPPAVKADPGKPHHVFNWKVPVRVGDRKATIAGSLDYVPAPKSSSTAMIVAIAAGGAVALLFAAGFFVFQRRRTPSGLS